MRRAPRRGERLRLAAVDAARRGASGSSARSSGLRTSRAHGMPPESIIKSPIPALAVGKEGRAASTLLDLHFAPIRWAGGFGSALTRLRQSEQSKFVREPRRKVETTPSKATVRRLSEYTKKAALGLCAGLRYVLPSRRASCPAARKGARRRGGEDKQQRRRPTQHRSGAKTRGSGRQRPWARVVVTLGEHTGRP